MKINSKLSPHDSLYHDAKTMLGIITTASETVTLPLAEFFRSANAYVKQAQTWIMQVQSTWKYDDSNQTDLPQATTDLVANQQDYSLKSVFKKIDKVEVLDGNGYYQPVFPITMEQIKEQGYSVSEFYKNAGLPVFYLLEGRSIFLFPKPSATDTTLTAGLKLYFNRDTVDFSITDTSTQPGFDVNYHRIVSVGASLDFATSRQMINSVNILTPKLNSLKNDLQEFYSSRQTENKPAFRVFREETI